MMMKLDLHSSNDTRTADDFCFDCNRHVVWKNDVCPSGHSRLAGDSDEDCSWCKQAANPDNHSVTQCPFH